MTHRLRRFANINLSICTSFRGRQMLSVRNISFGIQRPRSLLLENIRHFHVTQPLFSNMVAGGFAWAVGNYISQTSSGEKFDFRMWEFAIIFGSFVATPVAYLWYSGPFRGGLALIRFQSKTKFTKVFTQMLITNMILAPTQIALLISYFELVENPYKHNIYGAISRSLPTILAMCYTYWPLMDFLNFFFVPTKVRVLVTLVQSIIWSSIFSYVNARLTSGNFSLAGKSEIDFTTSFNE